MRTYRIIVEVVLKDDSIEDSDFIYQGIEELLEPLEQIVDYELTYWGRKNDK